MSRPITHTTPEREIKRQCEQARHDYEAKLADIAMQCSRRSQFEAIPRAGLLQRLAESFSSMPESWRGHGFGKMTKKQLVDLFCELYEEYQAEQAFEERVYTR